jgi:hypothetical protein
MMNLIPAQRSAHRTANRCGKPPPIRTYSVIIDFLLTPVPNKQAHAIYAVWLFAIVCAAFAGIL